jgi:hypothetical protein
MDLALCTPSVAFEATYLAGLDELETDGERSSWIYLGDSGDAASQRSTRERSAAPRAPLV